MRRACSPRRLRQLVASTRRPSVSPSSKAFLSLQPQAKRDWADLPLDLISYVLHLLSPVELLIGGAAGVCRSWRRAVRDEPRSGTMLTCVATPSAVSDRMSPSTRWCGPPCATAPGSARHSGATPPMASWSACSPSSEICVSVPCHHFVND